MQKTMYSAMRNLALYIASCGKMDFGTIWQTWSERYKPSEDKIPTLKKMGEKLCELESENIKNVPEQRYRKTILCMLTPEINKKELENENGE